MVRVKTLLTCIYIWMGRQERSEMEKKDQQVKQQKRKENIQQRSTEKIERAIAKVSLSMYTSCGAGLGSLVTVNYIVL